MTDKLTEIQVSVGKIEVGIDHLVKMHETTVKRLDSHGSDIKSLNRTRSRQAGFAKALSAVGIFIMGTISWFVDW